MGVSLAIVEDIKLMIRSATLRTIKTLFRSVPLIYYCEKREYLNRLSKFDGEILALFIHVQRYFSDCAIRLFLRSLSGALVFVAIENGREGLQAYTSDDSGARTTTKSRNDLGIKKWATEKLSRPEETPL